jgi:acyl-CoA reductase-like NAD-dependent aldehyde dehydrogenase
MGEMRRQHNAWVAIVPWPALCETPLAMILGNYNPADVRDVIGEFPASNAREVQDAVSAAQRALSAWRALRRAESLRRIG